MNVMIRNARGFSLVELMVALGVGAVVMTTFAGTMISQQRNAYMQLEATEAQQNARAVINILQRYIRAAGTSFTASPTIMGAIAIGGCFTPQSNPAALVPESKNGCDNAIDVGDTTNTYRSDRIRIAYANPDGMNHAAASANFSSGGTISVVMSPAATPGHPWAGTAPFMALISGTCSGDSNMYNDLFQVTAKTTGNPVQYTLAVATGFTTQLCSTRTYSIGSGGYRFAQAQVTDFYIDRSLGVTEPRLMVNFLPNRGMGQAQVVAYDIDDVQFRYGIDSLPNVALGDGIADIWCDDPSATGSTCNTGLSDRVNQARIVAVHMAVVARTRTARPDQPASSSMTNFNHTINGDNYKRWVFYTTVALRNNSIEQSPWQ